jgi:hypothetical protein
MSGIDDRRKTKEEGIMKKILVVAVAMMVVAMAGGAFAAGSATVGMTANVQAKCISDTNGFFNVFNIDPDSPLISLTTGADGISPTVKCTKNSTVTVTCTPALGSTGVLTSGTDPGGDIIYTVTACQTGWLASGFGTPNAIDIGIEIAADAAANSAAGNHTGQIIVTTNY